MPATVCCEYVKEFNSEQNYKKQQLVDTTRREFWIEAVAPDGRLAAFCVCWLHKDAAGEPVGQIEPLGVHQDWRQLGLGRAILSARLRRLYLGGADKVYVETDKQRNTALELYQAAGSGVVKDVLVYRQDYGVTQS